MDGVTFKQRCVETESIILAVACHDGVHGNLAIEFCGKPRQYTVKIEVEEGQCEGRSETLFEAFKQLLDSLKRSQK
jgi:hypothetical protein